MTENQFNSPLPSAGSGDVSPVSGGSSESAQSESAQSESVQSESVQNSSAQKKVPRRHFGTFGHSAPHRERFTAAAPQSDNTAAANTVNNTDTTAPKRKFDTVGQTGSGKSFSAASRPLRPAVLQAAVRQPIDTAFERTRLFLLAVIMVPLCIWASWPAWNSIVYEWYYSDDYSHGFLVVPATLLFLYLRRDSYPGTCYKLDWIGLFPLLLYGLLRIFAGIQYMEALDHIAILFWIFSVVWFFYGWRVFLWALPSLCFLVFMLQLPWTLDVLMRNRLQYFAAQFAALLLQLVGEAAIPIKNTIRLSTAELGVEAACSGLRFLMSVFAIAFATVLLMRRPWWQNILILAAAAPLALFVNAVRIAMTGIILVHFNETAARWAGEGHSAGVAADAFAGKIAIFLALGLFAAFVWFLGKVFRQVEI